MSQPQQQTNTSQSQPPFEGFEPKFNADKTLNPRYVDLLSEDKPIAGQKFGLFSFITPEKILKQKEMFYFEEFLKSYDYIKSLSKFTNFLQFLSMKYKINMEKLTDDLTDFLQTEKEALYQPTLEDDYKTYLEFNETRLQAEFSKKHNFQTSSRSFKSRGNFATQEEAEYRAKMLREADDSSNIYVGPVGQWLYWDPEPEKTARVEYMEEEVNRLFQEKKKNEELAKVAFDQRVKESKERAIAENKANAKKYGTVLTQSIDSEGNLFGVNSSTGENLETQSTTNAKLYSDLFETDEPSREVPLPQL